MGTIISYIADVIYPERVEQRRINDIEIVMQSFFSNLFEEEKDKYKNLLIYKDGNE